MGRPKKDKVSMLSENSPGQRVKWALTQRQITATELGRHLGLTRSAVCQWWAKTRPTSPSERLRDIAEYLHLSLHWLLTGEGVPWKDEGRASANTAVPLDIIAAHVIGIVEGEVWREGTSMGERLSGPVDPGDVFIPAVPRPDLQGMRQFALEVRGTVANQTAQPGSHVICVSYKDLRPGGPHEGDLVAVEKTRNANGRDERKVIVARVYFVKGFWELQYESSDERWVKEKPIRLAHDLRRDLNDDCAVDIVGLVLGVFIANPPPPKSKASILASLAGKVGLGVLCISTMMIFAAASAISVVGDIGYFFSSFIASWSIGPIRSTLMGWFSLLWASFFFYEPAYSFAVSSPTERAILCSLAVVGLLINWFVGFASLSPLRYRRRS